MNVWLAGFDRVGLHTSAPTTPTASSPIPRSALSSIITPVPMSGTLPRSPDSPYCLTKRTACPATKTAQTASTSLAIWARYGAKSRALSGTQSFWTTLPPLSSNTRWKPPISSWPKALSMAMTATRRYLSVLAA